MKVQVGLHAPSVTPEAHSQRRVNKTPSNFANEALNGGPNHLWIVLQLLHWHLHSAPKWLKAVMVGWRSPKVFRELCSNLRFWVRCPVPDEETRCLVLKHLAAPTRLLGGELEICAAGGHGQQDNLDQARNPSDLRNSLRLETLTGLFETSHVFPSNRDGLPEDSTWALPWLSSCGVPGASLSARISSSANSRASPSCQAMQNPRQRKVVGLEDRILELRRLQVFKAQQDPTSLNFNNCATEHSKFGLCQVPCRSLGLVLFLETQGHGLCDSSSNLRMHMAALKEHPMMVLRESAPHASRNNVLLSVLTATPSS